jgi:ABC-type transport system involved in multi-copper enzyme maturation permease subunit
MIPLTQVQLFYVLVVFILFMLFIVEIVRDGFKSALISLGVAGIVVAAFSAALFFWLSVTEWA